MLTFTARGVVGTPRTVQIRFGVAEAGALRAGAPVPSRAMSIEEVEAEVRWFTAGRRGPRTVPCNVLVLSGVRGAVHGLGRVARLARELGVERVVVHGAAPPDLVAVADQVAIAVERPEDVPREPPHRSWVAHVPLTAAVCGSLGAIAERLAASRPTRVVLAWPFPSDESVLPVPQTLAAAREARARLVGGGVAAVVRGLPPCLDTQEGARSAAGRTGNRFYVDADHRAEAALLFVPDIVQFLKPDSCRACAFAASCDGVARAWLESGAVGALEPIPIAP